LPLLIRVPLRINIRPLHMRNLRLQELILHTRLPLVLLELLGKQLPPLYLIGHLLVLLDASHIALSRAPRASRSRTAPSKTHSLAPYIAAAIDIIPYVLAAEPFRLPIRYQHRNGYW